MERKLVASKKPTDSDQTWYNLYSDGYVEQKGLAERNTVVTLPIEMTDTNYVAVLSGNATTNNFYSYGVNAIRKTPASFEIKTESSSVALTGWEVSGYAAESEYIDKIVRREFIAY